MSILLSIFHSQESQIPPHLSPQPPPRRYENIAPQHKLSREGRVDETDAGNDGSNISGSSHINGSTTDGDDDGAVFDPNLMCLGCQTKFRHGEIQLYRRHVNSCEEMKTYLKTKRELSHPLTGSNERGSRDESDGDT